MNQTQASIAPDHQQPRVQSVTRMCTALFAFFVAFLSGADVARAVMPRDYFVRARVDRSRSLVEGAMWARVRVDASDREINFWLYPARTSIASSIIDEISERWIYPDEISLGDLVVTDVRVDGVSAPAERIVSDDPARRLDAAGADLRVSIAAGPAREVLVRMRFSLRVPVRFGRFGVVDDQMTLAAPWYPVVVDGDTFAFPVPHRVELEVLGGDHALLGDALGQGVLATTRIGSFVPAVIAPQLHVQQVQDGAHALRFVSVSEQFRQPADNVRGLAGLRDIVRVDRVEPMVAAWRDVLATASLVAIEVPAVTTVVQIADWLDIASVAPGWALVSEHAFEVVPSAIAVGFHERAVKRAMFRNACERIGNEPASERDVTADLRAVLLTDLDGVRRGDTRQRPEEILKFASFHPAVDQILYAPQVPFEQVYFGAIDEVDRFRDAPSHARIALASGRRVLEGMRDAMTEAELQAVALSLLRDGVAFRDALAHVRPDLSARVDQWFAWPRLPVNYRLGDVTSTPSQGGYEHRVEVIREGARRAEPVAVEVIDADGNTLFGQWNGEGERGVVGLRSAAELVDVQIDPAQRVTQSPQVAEEHPFADDTASLPLRPPLLRGWDLSYAPAQDAWSTYIDVAVRPKFDLTHTVGFGAAANVRASGGYIEYEQGLGPKVHSNRRIGAVAAGVDVRRLHSGFAESADGGVRFAVTTRAVLSSVAYLPDPRHGFYANSYARFGLVRRDQGDWATSFAGGIRVGTYLPVGLRNVTLLVAGLDGVAGQALDSELPDLADGVTMRGFVFGELLGRARGYALIEHRFTALSNLAWNLLHTAWVREVQLALFAAGGAVIDPIAGNQPQLHAEVGTGVRFHFHVGGIQPSLFRIDVARPLTRRRGRSRPPLGVIVGFEQPY